jgi:hypothetical protein
MAHGSVSRNILLPGSIPSPISIITVRAICLAIQHFLFINKYFVLVEMSSVIAIHCAADRIGYSLKWSDITGSTAAG